MKTKYNTAYQVWKVVNGNFQWVFCSYKTYLKYRSIRWDSARQRQLQYACNQWHN